MAEQEILDGNIPKTGTELDEAAAFWGKELASENGEESLEEEPETDPEESEDQDSEDVQEEEYEEQYAEAEPEQQLYKVRSDGEDIEVPLDELISGYSRHSSYTKKSQSLAEERKNFENEKAEASQMRQQAIQILESAQSSQSQTQEKDSQYWQELKDSDPMQFMLERDELRESQMQNQMREQQLQQLKAQEEAERQANFDNYLATQRKNLDELIPEWKDEKVASQEKKLIIEYGKSIGFSDEELEKAYDSRAVATMRKAMLYDQLSQKRGTLKPVKRGSMKAGSQSVDLSNVKSKKASDKLRKSGRVEDAASVFYNMIRN